MKNKFLLTFVSVFVAVVLIFSGALGLITLQKNARAVVKYDGVIADKGAVTYLASYYKMLYLRSLRTSGVDASDTDAFWASEMENGNSYGEHFTNSFREYIASVISAANIYINYSSYTAEDKYNVNMTAEEILKYRANGSVVIFNEKAERYGFEYTDFLSAAALLYKAEGSQDIMYGEDGKNLINHPDECEKYLDTYSHVSLLFIRTETLLATDEDGNYIFDESGNVVLRGMTDAEREERETAINALTSAIEAKKNGGDMQITPQMFENYLATSDGDAEMHQTGYYFHPSAAATAEFSEAFPEVVEASLTMEKYDYQKVDCSIGVCFIYKYDALEDAYTDSDNPFFSDFYTDAKDYLYAELLSELTSQVEFRDSYTDIDVLSIPAIKELYIKEWKRDDK